MAKNEVQEVDTVETGDEPLLDLNDASVKKMIARAKKRGVVTYEELNKALPQTWRSTRRCPTPPAVSAAQCNGRDTSRMPKRRSNKRSTSIRKTRMRNVI